MLTNTFVGQKILQRGISAITGTLRDLITGEPQEAAMLHGCVLH